MKTIHKLSPSQIAKIAAGEVIEKPAYAVKELIENSIDAQATHIQVTIEEGGLKKINIIDNGIGMNPEDLKESFKLHTTSKIMPTDNLVSIRSMGFRGEALASIASISRLSLQSRQKNSNSGTKIVVEGGKLISTLPVGMPEGTQIEVADLFYSIPARKKFIENPQKEFRLILEWITKIAIAHPDIRFTFRHNNRLIFDVPIQTLTQRLEFFLGKESVSRILPIKFEDSYIKITGFTSLPDFSTSSSSKQLIFVNNRPIIDRLIITAVREVYGNIIENQKNPVFILHLTLPPEMVDVNVHPRKEQINFFNKQLVFDQIQKAIYQTLQLSNPIKKSNEKSVTNSYAGNILKQVDELFSLEKKFVHSLEIMQIHDLFLLFQTQNGYIIVDQHAAHERILFEQFISEFNKKTQKKLKLKIPLLLDLSVIETEIILQNLQLFEKMGFKIINHDEITVTHIPEILRDRDISEIITQLTEQLYQDKKLTLDSKTDQMLKYLACRSAVKQGDKLDKKQSKDLVRQLFKTANHAYCPHGRPTYVEYSLSELFKVFKRF